MREATKWVMAFVPTAAVVVALGTLVPRLAELDHATRARTAAAWWLAVGVVAALAALVLAARVLTVGPAGWRAATAAAARTAKGADVAGPPPRSLTAELDGEGVLRLYGYRSATEFFAAVAVADRGNGSALLAAGTAVMDFAAFRAVRARFRWFVGLGAVAVGTAAFAVAAAAFTIADAPPAPVTVTEPLPVRLVLSDVGRDELAEAAGCAPAGSVTGWAVAGAVTEPVVVLDAEGEGCAVVEVRWHARFGAVVPAQPGP
jgi:hypothetical protein